MPAFPVTLKLKMEKPSISIDMGDMAAGIVLLGATEVPAGAALQDQYKAFLVPHRSHPDRGSIKHAALNQWLILSLISIRSKVGFSTKVGRKMSELPVIG